MSKLIFITVLLFASLCGAYEKDYKDAKPDPAQVKLVKEILAHNAKQWKLNMGTPREQKRAKYLAGKAARKNARRQASPKRGVTISPSPAEKMGQMCRARMIIDMVMPNGIVLAHRNIYISGQGATLNQARSRAYSYAGASAYIENVPTDEPWVRPGAKVTVYMYLTNRADGKLVYVYQGGK